MSYALPLLSPCPYNIDSSVSSWGLAEFLENGFYGLYFYLRKRRSTPQPARTQFEDWVWGKLQFRFPMMTAALDTYYKREARHQVTVLTMDTEIEWATSELRKRFNEEIKKYNPYRLAMRGRLDDAVKAHRYLSTVLAMWSAMERTLAEICGDPSKAGWYASTKPGRESCYTEMYTAYMKVTDEWNTLDRPRDAVPQRRGGISI